MKQEMSQPANLFWDQVSYVTDACRKAALLELEIGEYSKSAALAAYRLAIANLDRLSVITLEKAGADTQVSVATRLLRCMGKACAERVRLLDRVVTPIVGTSRGSEKTRPTSVARSQASSFTTSESHLISESQAPHRIAQHTSVLGRGKVSFMEPSTAWQGSTWDDGNSIPYAPGVDAIKRLALSENSHWMRWCQAETVRSHDLAHAGSASVRTYSPLIAHCGW